MTKLILTITIGWSTGVLAADLPLPPQENSAITIERAIQRVLPGRELVLMPLARNFIVSTPFNSEGKTREERFGEVIHSFRYQVKELGKASHLVAGYRRGRDIMLFDAGRLEIYRITMEYLPDGVRPSYQFVSQRGVVWDRILPLGDGAGSVPQWKIAKVRREFKKAFRAAKKRIFAVQPWWEGKSEHGLLALSLIPTFPVLELRCSNAIPNKCRVHQACQFHKDWQGYDGMALFKDGRNRQQMLVANKEQHEIHRFEIKSCRSIASIGKLTVDPKLKALAGVAVDADQRLWVSTSEPDDYTNASVFFWPKEVWLTVPNQ